MTDPIGARSWRGRVFVGVSLDGRIARPDGDLGWLTDPPGGRDHAPVGEIPGGTAQTWERFSSSVDTIVMGRSTYETVLGFPEWPYPGRRVLVLTRGLLTDDSRVEVVRGVGEAAAALEATGAREVYVDGGRTIQSFLAAGLIDELTVCWAPVLLGAGRPLFGELAGDVTLVLVGALATEGGTVHATYRVHRPAVPESAFTEVASVDGAGTA